MGRHAVMPERAQVYRNGQFIGMLPVNPHWRTQDWVFFKPSPPYAKLMNICTKAFVASIEPDNHLRVFLPVIQLPTPAWKSWFMGKDKALDATGMTTGQLEQLPGWTLRRF